MSGTSFTDFETRFLHQTNSSRQVATLHVVPHPSEFAPLALFIVIAFAVLVLLTVLWCVQCLNQGEPKRDAEKQAEGTSRSPRKSASTNSHPFYSSGNRSSFGGVSFGDIVGYEVVRSSITDETDSVFLRDINSETPTCFPQDAIPTPSPISSLPDVRYGKGNKQFIVEKVPEPSRAFVF